MSFKQVFVHLQLGVFLGDFDELVDDRVLTAVWAERKVGSLVVCRLHLLDGGVADEGCTCCVDRRLGEIVVYRLVTWGRVVVSDALDLVAALPTQSVGLRNRHAMNAVQHNLV